MVVLFNKLLPGQRDTQLLLDLENYSYRATELQATELQHEEGHCSQH